MEYINGVRERIKNDQEHKNRVIIVLGRFGRKDISLSWNSKPRLRIWGSRLSSRRRLRRNSFWRRKATTRRRRGGGISTISTSWRNWRRLMLRRIGRKQTKSRSRKIKLSPRRESSSLQGSAFPKKTTRRNCRGQKMSETAPSILSTNFVRKKKDYFQWSKIHSRQCWVVCTLWSQ